MCVRIHICLYMYIDICVCIHVYVYLYTCIDICICVHIYVCVYINTYVCVYKCICDMCLYIQMYIERDRIGPYDCGD